MLTIRRSNFDTNLHGSVLICVGGSGGGSKYTIEEAKQPSELYCFQQFFYCVSNLAYNIFRQVTNQSKVGTDDCFSCSVINATLFWYRLQLHCVKNVKEF